MNEEIVTWLQNNWDTTVAVIAIVVTASSAVAALVPTPPPGTFLSKLFAIIDWLALNVRHAKETGEPPTVKKPE